MFSCDDLLFHLPPHGSGSSVQRFLKSVRHSGSGAYRILLLLLLLGISTPQKAQTPLYSNEEELKKQAAKFFEDEDYGNGYKAYSQLVSTYPKDPNYNYRLGVCMLYTDPDKKKCYPYLEFADKNIKDCEKEAKFYLAKAYHSNFRFDDAIKLYTDYKSMASGGMVRKLQVDMEIQACKNGKKLLSNLNELVVIDKKQLPEGEYFRSYNLKSIGGKLLVKPEEYMTAADKKKKNKSIVYLPKSNDQLYYSSYGSGDNKDIYIVRKLPNGEWSKPQSLGAPINTAYDEDYPFLHPNGRVLYFASKGHNSMGGYDLFKSEFDENTRTWGQPVNLDFPINTPNDDILFVTDSLEKTAYFSSTRQSPVGRIDVFKISTERRAPEFVYIKGNVMRMADGQNLRSRITIKDINAGENVGTFQAEVSGKYLLKIPNGGKFIFTVESEGYPTQSEGIDIPVNNSLLPYGQAISYKDQTLVIKNFFETNPGDENAYKDNIEIIEAKSKLDVNAGDFTTPAVTNTVTASTNGGTTTTNGGNNPPQNNGTGTNNNPSNTNTNGNLSNQQLEKIAFEDAKELQQEAVKLKSDANDAFTFVNNQKIEAETKEKEALQAIENANRETDPIKKEPLLNKANELKEEAKRLEDQATLAENIAKQLDIDANNKQKEADLQQKYAEQLQQVNKSKNSKEALQKLEAIQKEQEQLANAPKNSTGDLANSIKNEAIRKDEEVQKLEPSLNRIKNEVTDLKKEMSDIDKEISATKDKTLLENLKTQKEDLTTELNNKIAEQTKTENKISLLKKESDALKSQADFTSNMLTEVKSTDNVVAINNTNGTGTNNGTTATSGTNGTNTSGSNTNSTTGIPSNNNNGQDNGTTPISSQTQGNDNLTAIQKEQKKFDEQSNKLNQQPESSARYTEQNQLIDSYIAAVDKEITDQKAELKKAKTGAEKTAINNRIKELEADKKDKQDDKNINDSKIAYFKNIESNTASTNPVATNGNNGTTTNGGTNGNNGTPENTNGSTTNTSGTNTNGNPENNQNGTTASSGNNPALNELNGLSNSAGSFTNTEEQQLFADNNYSDPAANTLRQKAEATYNTAVADAKNTADKISTAQNNLQNSAGAAPKNTEKIGQLNTEADNLLRQVSDLRKKTNSLTGQAKTDNQNKVKELETQAGNKKFEAVSLTAKDNESSFWQNEKIIDEYKTANGTKTNADLAKAQTLLNEAKTLYNQAMRIEEEANAEQDINAKSAAYSNVEDKELQALKKQEEALALYKKNNPNLKPSATQNAGNDAAIAGSINDIKNELNKEEQDKIRALQELAEANKQEYAFVMNQLKMNESKPNGTNGSIQQKEQEAVNLYNEANALLSNTGNSTITKEKNAMLMDANRKLKEAIIKTKEANAESGQLQAASGSVVSNNGNNPNNTSNGGTGNPENTNNGNPNTNGNQNTNGTNAIAGNGNPNTNGTNNGTGNNGNPTNNGNPNTNGNPENNGATATSSGTVTPTAKLTETQIKQVQATTEYKNYTALVNEVTKYEASADKESSKAENYYNQATMYLKESNDLRIQLDKLPPGDERNLKQEQAMNLDRMANEFKAKGDSVRELASNTKAFADSKKMEAEAYSQSLDPKILENIQIASGQKSNNAPQNTNTTPNNTENANTGKYAEYSPAFRDNATKYDEDLKSFSNAEPNEGNLTAQNQILNNYNKAIDTEIAAEKKKLSTANAADKAKINKRITDLQTQKSRNTQTVSSNTNKIKALQTSATANNNANQNPENNTASNNGNQDPNNNNPPDNNGNPPSNNNNGGTNGGNNTSGNVSGITVKNNNAYSSSNPIPIDEKLPNGIIFAVQIGAFRNQIPDDLFKGLSPLRGERTGSGLIRYQAGRFEKFDNANAVRNDLKKLGYKDAFVVAYKDGQRISLADAINELKNKGISINNDPNETAGITVNSNVPNANTVSNTLGNNATNGTNANNTTPATNNTPVAVSPTDLNDMQGMLFTVQVGVYSNQVSSGQLYNLKPIYRERLTNGNYRYTAGIYNNIDRVKTDRAKVNNLGINDAFVSAYLNGQRIKVADALAKVNAGENVQFPQENPIRFGDAAAPTNTVTPVASNTVAPSNTVTPNNNNGGTAPFSNGVTQAPQPTAENGVKTGDEGITFKVQIGAYKNQVPQNVANNFLKIKNWPIQANQVNGLYIYSVGSFVNARSARPLLEEAKANGIADAFITVYRDGKKLYGQEATNYLSQQ